MQVYAVLPAESLDFLMRSLSPEARVDPLALGSAAAVLERARHGSVLVIDPSVLTARAAVSIRDAMRRSGLPTCLYANASEDTAHRVLVLAVSGDVEILFRGAPDERTVLRRLVERRFESTAPALVLSYIAASLQRLTRELKLRATGLFGWLRLPNEAVLNRGPHMHHRTTDYRQLARAGLGPWSLLVAGARIARAWSRADDIRTVGLLADRLGYSSSRVLSAHSHRFLSCSFRKAQRTLSTEEVAARIARVVSRP